MCGPSPRKFSFLASCYCWECESRTQLRWQGSYRVRQGEKKKQMLQKTKIFERRKTAKIFLWKTHGKKKIRAVWSSLNKTKGIIATILTSIKLAWSWEISWDILRNPAKWKSTENLSSGDDYYKINLVKSYNRWLWRCILKNPMTW